MASMWPTQESDTVAEDEATWGAMLVSIILGADKTTVSTQTGHTEYHPVYISVGNVRNETRRAHRDAVVPLAFLSIPPARTTKSSESSSGNCITPRWLVGSYLQPSPRSNIHTDPDEMPRWAFSGHNFLPRPVHR
ncbi:hypothetical protein BDV98DRAFT_606581 [Pterulicium gracile]|uniref:Uncharacterized protein n=1 Tax=Pterulicium gracile TaxID=1884261 RepID=A0A5C3Q9P9_9AGAR|nr:hypothetical protein BDV98DRAFT_606581 [Pterula gracilis]